MIIVASLAFVPKTKKRFLLTSLAFDWMKNTFHLRKELINERKIKNVNMIDCIRAR